MRRLCGWESQSGIPSESTISRTFGDFAVDEIASSLFKDFVKKVAKGRIVIHRSIDSTEIDARESAATKDEKTAAAELAAIRAQVDANTEDCNALALQKERDLDTNLSLLPTLCDWGCKRNSKGKTQCWRGYKLHDAHGGRTVRVRGRAKVLLHLILGLLVIAVEQSAQML